MKNMNKINGQADATARNPQKSAKPVSGNEECKPKIVSPDAYAAMVSRAAMTLADLLESSAETKTPLAKAMVDDVLALLPNSFGADVRRAKH